MVYIKRILESELEKQLKRKEILAIIGPRQAGKTTLVQHLLKECKNVNNVTFDDVNAKNLFIENIDAFISEHVKSYDYLFIDEIQYVPDSGQKLKYIYDTQKIKIIISGSSASEISITSLKYLVGRVFIYHLYPLSFEEFLSYKNKNLLLTIKKNPYKAMHNLVKPLLEEYLKFGGYPSVVLAEDEEDKKTILKNIYNTYFLREIKEIFYIKDDYKLVRLLKALALQIGNIVNYQEMAGITNYSTNEIKEYLSILKKTFICQEAMNFHTNKRNELKKSPKIFFVDTGFRNTVINNFSLEANRGSINENLVAQEIIKKDLELKYWRTQSKAEVDFVIEKENKIMPVEVKNKINKTVIGKSLFSFIEQYEPSTTVIISTDYEAERIIKSTNKTKKETKISFIPIIKTPFIL